MGRLTLRGGYAIVKLETKKGDGRQTPSNSDERPPRPRGPVSPSLDEADSTMTVSLNGTELLRGVFVKD